MTITNLSGDLSTWTEIDAGGAITTLTQAQFLAEREAAGDSNAYIPPGHIDANGIVKLTISIGSAQQRIQGTGLDGAAMTSYKNIFYRCYVPPEEADLWESAPASSFRLFYYSGTPGSIDFYSGLSSQYDPGSASVRLSLGHTTVPMIPNFFGGAGMLDELSYTFSDNGSPTTLDFVHAYHKGNATAEQHIYVFDMVTIEDETPKIYLRFDDGSDDHYTVAAPALQSYGYSGLFSIYKDALGTANFMTEAQCLEMYTKYGLNLCVHGNGSGSTWGGGASTKQVMHDEITNCRNFYTTNKLPKCFNEAVTFVGNDYFSKTSDTETRILMELARDREGFKIATGHPNFGYGFSMGALADPMQTASIQLCGSNAGYVDSTADMEDVLTFMKFTGLSIVLLFHSVDAISAIGVSEAQFNAILAAIDVEVQAGNVAVGDFMADAYANGHVTDPGITSDDRGLAGSRTIASSR